MERKSIGREAAIALYESGWWSNKSDREIAEFQMLTNELCMPFDLFHKAVEACLERPVYTHEFGLDYKGLVLELLGDRPAPSFEQIVSLIPKEKLFVVAV